MFNFFNEIKDKFKTLQSKSLPYQSVMIGNYLIYVEGFSSLILYSNQSVVFKVKNGVLTISGESLIIKEMSISTITISGEIKSVEYV